MRINADDGKDDSVVVMVAGMMMMISRDSGRSERRVK